MSRRVTLAVVTLFAFANIVTSIFVDNDILRTVAIVTINLCMIPTGAWVWQRVVVWTTRTLARGERVLAAIRSEMEAQP